MKEHLRSDFDNREAEERRVKEWFDQNAPDAVHDFGDVIQTDFGRSWRIVFGRRGIAVYANYNNGPQADFHDMMRKLVATLERVCP